jgi:hypothetical protein
MEWDFDELDAVNESLLHRGVGSMIHKSAPAMLLNPKDQRDRLHRNAVTACNIIRKAI